MQKRKAAREAIKQVLESIVAEPVFVERDIDGREDAEFYGVFLDSGSASYEGLYQAEEAELVISYRNRTQLTDDQVDDEVEPVEEQLQAQVLASAGIRGIVYSGFEYLDYSERSFSGIDLRYTVYY